MKEKTLTVQIFGQPGSGKSALAKVIFAVARAYGFSVRIFSSQKVGYIRLGTESQELFSVSFASQKDAERALWCAARFKRPLNLQYGGDGRVRGVLAIKGGDLMETTDSSGGDIAWDEEPVFGYELE